VGRARSTVSTVEPHRAIVTQWLDGYNGEGDANDEDFARVLVVSRASGRGMARSLLWLDTAMMGGTLVFAFAGSFGLAVVAYWAIRVAASLAGPVYSTWLNSNIDDSSVRATVISITNLGNSAGQWGGGPALGAVGSVYGIRAALAAGAVALSPALVLYGLAIRHGGREPGIEAVPQAEA